MNNATAPTRVDFHDGQYLDADDLRTEQTYHTQQRWRHNLALHSWGICAGLEVTLPLNTQFELNVAVQPGMALDGYGRELVYAQAQPVKVLADPNKSYDVWLEYSEELKTKPSTAFDCAELVTARCIEQPLVKVRPTAARETTDPATPKEVPTGDRNFGPAQSLPDLRMARWPVFLGQLEFRENKWNVVPTQRRYAGLIADRILAPAKPFKDGGDAFYHTAILNGTDPNLSPYHFAVALAEQAKNADRIKGLVTEPVFAIRTTGEIDFRTPHVAVESDLLLRRGAALEFEANRVSSTDAHAQELNGAQHWRMYHHFDTPKPKAGEDPTFSDELRLTMPSQLTSTNSIAIGSFGEEGVFTPILVVKDAKGEKTVEVYGTLIVNGDIQGNVAAATAGTPGDPNRYPPNLILQQLVRHIGDGTIKISDVYPSILKAQPLAEAMLADAISIAGQARLKEVTKSFWDAPTNSGRVALGSTMSTDETNVNQFLDEMEKDIARLPLIANWLFAAANNQRSPEIAKVLPSTQTDALKAFAKELIDNNLAGAKALVVALLNEAGDANALLEAMLSATNGKDRVADELLVGSTLNDLVRTFDDTQLGTLCDKLLASTNGAAFLTKLGEKLPATTGWKPLVDGVCKASETKAQALLTTLAQDTTAADRGRKALVAALREGVTAPGNATAAAYFATTNATLFANLIRYMRKRENDGGTENNALIEAFALLQHWSTIPPAP